MMQSILPLFLIISDNKLLIYTVLCPGLLQVKDVSHANMVDIASKNQET